MGQFLGFGSGIDGDLVISSNTTDSPIDATCTGNAGSLTLFATNASFAANQIILIHQTKGSGAGTWELAQIASYVAGTITLKSNLVNNYVAGAQCLVLKQYSSYNLQSGINLTAKNWNGSLGGITAFLCSGNSIIGGNVNSKGGDSTGVGGTNSSSGATGAGFKGGDAVRSTTAQQQGEGTAGAGSNSTSANGNGGGGGSNSNENGAGGGNANAGTNGVSAAGGSAVGTSDLSNINLGGGGGGGASNNTSGTERSGGGAGGGIVLIFSASIDTSVGTISVNGGTSDINNGGFWNGGGGAGGSVLIRSRNAILGTNKITAIGGKTGGSGPKTGSDGRIRIEACQLTGSTNQGSVSTVNGGQSWCGSSTLMI